MDERLAWKLASDRAKDGEDDIGSENGLPKLRWRSLYGEDRHKEKDPSQLEPRVDQWRMKERVRDFRIKDIGGNPFRQRHSSLERHKLELRLFL